MLTARLAMGLVFVAKWVERFWPADRLPEIQTKTIDDRLAVATFSLGILVSALSSSATAAAPRATELLMGNDDTPDVRAIRNCFVLGATRGYDQDPRFGLIVLSEVARRQRPRHRHRRAGNPHEAGERSRSRPGRPSG